MNGSDGATRPSRLRPSVLWAVLKQAGREWVEDDTATLGAALAYYMIFSLAPVLVIAIAVAGIAFGEQAVQGEVAEEIGGLLGEAGARQVETMIRGAYRPGRGGIAALLAAALLLVGATAVFGQLRRALDVVWHVRAKPGRGLVKLVRDRIFSFAMVVCISFLLMVSLVAHASLIAAAEGVRRQLSDTWLTWLKLAELVVSFGLSTLLFTVIFRFMSDARVKWKDAWPGGAFTAALFAFGKFLIGTYLGRSAVNDAYGVAGSIVLLLMWVFYSSQILFFGAEFTEAFAKAGGSSITPGPFAVSMDDPIEPPAAKPRE